MILRHALDQVRNRYAMRQFWTLTLDDGRRVLMCQGTPAGSSSVCAVLEAL
jgi:hypothetical protein